MLNVQVRKLWDAQEENGINLNIIQVIKNLYSDNISHIKIGNKILLPGFKVTKSLRQGCSISPTLFKIYLEKKFNGMGLPPDDDTIYKLNFADDQVLVAKDYEDI